MDRSKLKQRTISMLLTAAVALPTAAIPVQLFAQEGDMEDFESFSDGSSAVKENSEVQKESGFFDMIFNQLGFYADANNSNDYYYEDPITIDLQSALKSNLKVPTLPGSPDIAGSTVTDQTGNVELTLDFNDLLVNVPEIYGKLHALAAAINKDPGLWKLQSMSNGTMVDGLPITLQVELPENVKFAGDATATPSKAEAAMESTEPIVSLNNSVANIKLNFGNGILYNDLMAAISAKTLGTWTIKLPVQYSVSAGTDISTSQVSMSGTAGSPFHRTGFAGIGVGMSVNVPQVQSQAFASSPITPTGVVDDTIDITSGLAFADGKTSAKLQTNDPFTLIGSLDVTPIKEKLNSKIGGYDVSQLLEDVKVMGTSLTMTATVSLPSEVTWDSSMTDSVTLDEKSATNFSVESAELDDSQNLIITFALKNKQIDNLDQLVKIMEATPDAMELNIGGFSAQSTTGETPASMTCKVNGVFKANALIPLETARPGLFDITYTMRDNSNSKVDLTVTAPSNPGGGSGGGSGSGGGAVVTKTVDLYRLYNPNSGEHFYTQNAEEKDFLVEKGWKYEGVGWTSPTSSKYPVYRLYNPNAGDHHFTLDANERDVLTTVGWQYEGISWYSLPANQGVKVYREYNPNAKEAGAHNYTTNKAENDYLISIGWLDEGIGWWAVK